jgi:hypothetical protein
MSKLVSDILISSLCSYYVFRTIDVPLEGGGIATEGERGGGCQDPIDKPDTDGFHIPVRVSK